MPQTVRGVIGNLTGLSAQVEAARRAKGLTWEGLAAGSRWTRQYLQSVVRASVVPLEVIEFLAEALNIRPTLDVAPAVSLLLQPVPET
mgnify:FL=1